MQKKGKQITTLSIRALDGALRHYLLHVGPQLRVSFLT